MQYLTAVVLLITLTLVNAINITMKGRIIGGHPIDIENHPYMVSLRSHDKHICGGSIIAPDTILTAAHCIHTGHPLQFTVRSGSNSADLGTIHQVYEIQKHYLYDPLVTSYDVAKLKITPPITYSSKSQPIKLCSERPADNTLLVISGWGRQQEGGQLTAEQRQNLREVHVRAVNQDACTWMYQNKAKITSLMMCAAAIGKDSCQGDSGGPLVNKQTGEQCGVASWGIGCANPRFPGVYASVPDLLDFIKS